MTLTPADRQRIREAFQARVGNTALPSGATIDDLCRNLVLAIPALLDALDGMEDHKADIQRDRNEIASREDGYRRQIDAQAKIIATLTAQLEADPCP